MSYSEHRPGRFGSEGQIEFEVANEHEAEPLYLQDLKDAERRAAEGEDSSAGAGDDTIPAPVTDAVPAPATDPAQEIRDAVKGIRDARGDNETEIFDFDE